MKIRLPEKRVAGLLAALIHLWARTMRITIHDSNGFLTGPAGAPGICVVWHNRILGLVMAGLPRVGKVPMTVLTSPSRDGELLAQVMERIGLQAVRGSSKKRGAAALLELRDHARAGRTLIITPDGPRGPVYQLSPGVLLLAQKTGLPLYNTHVSYSKARRLQSWDRFFIPWPFSKIEVRVDPAQIIPPTTDETAFETARLALQTQLGTD